MGVCKFFLEGRCRYGKNCFNDHVMDNRYKYQSDRFDKSEFSQNKPRYTDRYATYDYYGYDNNQYDERHTSNYGYKGNSYRQNQYSWEASDSRKAAYGYQPSRYDFSSKFNKPQVQNPVSQSTFSFKQSNRFNVLNDSRFAEVNTPTSNVDLDMEGVKEDMVSWEKGQHWQFSCYSPYKGHQSFPDFKDTSPEELRYNAYEAKKNNEFPIYNSIKGGNVSQDEQQTMLSGIGFLSNTISSSTGASNFSFKKTASGSSGFGLSRLMGNNFKDATSENMNEISMMDNSSVPQFSSPAKPIDFSFKMPSAELKIVDKGKNLLYTSITDLNTEERAAFDAQMFTLGKIPIRPPPMELCF